MESVFYGFETLKLNTMGIDIKLINKYIERIKIDYPEDDKLMIDLQQFAQEIVKNCSIPDVVGQSEQLRAFKQFLQSEYHLPVSNRMIDEFEQKKSS